MVSKNVTTKAGRKVGMTPHIIELRAYVIKDLYLKGIVKQDLAKVFNVHPSQVTRALKR